jgi:uncharacterized protein
MIINYLRILLCVSFVSLFLACGKSKKIIFAGGFKGGTYYKIAESISSMPGYSSAVIPTNGSLDNILLVSGKKADYSLTQLDMLQNYSIGEPEVKEKVKMLLPLYGEEVHLVARKEIKDLKSLAGKKISIGPSNSGMKISSLIFLGQIGVEEGQITMEEIETEKAIPMLLKKELDAVVLIAGQPVKILSEIPASEKNNIHLLEFAGDLYQAVGGTNLTYQKADIPANTYTWQDTAVKTLVVQSVLIAKNDLSNKDILDFVNTLFVEKEKLVKAHPKWKSLDKSLLKYYYEKDPSIFHPAIKEIIPSK